MTSLEVLRRERGRTQAAFARVIGISRQAYAAIEAGKAEPSVSTALRIARELESTVEELFLPASAAEEPMVVGSLRGNRITHGWADLQGRGSFTLPDVIGDRRVGDRSHRSSVFLAGCDPILGLLAQSLNDASGPWQFHWLNTSNADSRSLFDRGLVHVALQHAETSDEALSAPVGVPLCRWELVLVTRHGRHDLPTTLDALGESSLRIAARQPGSGVRGFLDRWASDAGIDTERLYSDAMVCRDHASVAIAVEAGWADLGLTNSAVGSGPELLSVSVGQQTSRLLIAHGVDAHITDLISERVGSKAFKRVIHALSGYESVA